MKDRGISRDVGVRHRRSAGDAPSLGPLNRMLAPTGPKGERRRRRRTAEDGEPHARRPANRGVSVLLVWTVTLAFLAVVTVAGVFFLWLKPFVERREQMAMEAGRPGQFVPVDVPVPEIPLLGEVEAVELAKRALKARDPVEVEKRILPGPVEAGEVVAFLKGLKELDGDIVRYDWMDRLDTAREDVKGVLVTFQKENTKRNRIALLVQDGNDWKMDFPAFARLAVPEWNEFFEGKVESAEVRVYLAIDHYFNGPFKESEGWRCFGLASPDVPDLMFGYCKIDGAQAKALDEILLHRKKMSRVTLEIERMEGAEKRQYVIKRVLAEDWAKGKTPLDEMPEGEK